MRRIAGWLAVGIFVSLVAIGLFRSDATPRARNSYGTGPHGYRALHDTLARLGFAVSRGTSADAPSAGVTWWLDASVCGRRAGEPPWPGLALARRGGTAVAFLRPVANHAVRCRLGEGLRIISVPAMRGRGTGSDTPGTLTLGGAHFASLKRTPGWTVVTTYAGRPFVLERAFGSGRVVVVADGSFLTNRLLGEADNAFFAVGLVGPYGAPMFDEAASLRHTRGMLSYLASSPAAALFAGLAMLALLVAWHGMLVPARTLPALDDPAPRLDAFVDSMAALYGRTRDHGRVLDRYREVVLGMLRRHFALPPEVPAPAVIERAGRVHGVDASSLELLARGADVGDARALREAAARLDGVLRTVGA